MSPGSPSRHTFAGLSLERVPDETTILNGHCLPEKRELAAGILGVIDGWQKHDCRCVDLGPHPPGNNLVNLVFGILTHSETNVRVSPMSKDRTHYNK